MSMRGYVSIGDDGGVMYFNGSICRGKEVVVIDSGDMNPSHATVITADFKNG